MAKSIHASKLWQGAVFALKINGLEGRPIVWYYFDYRDAQGYIYYTALHDFKEYKSQNPFPDRHVWLRH